MSKAILSIFVLFLASNLSAEEKVKTYVSSICVCRYVKDLAILDTIPSFGSVEATKACAETMNADSEACANDAEKAEIQGQLNCQRISRDPRAITLSCESVITQ